ncbi:hypothetical protein D3C86_736070 [compost metagenome]
MNFLSNYKCFLSHAKKLYFMKNHAQYPLLLLVLIAILVSNCGKENGNNEQEALLLVTNGSAVREQQKEKLASQSVLVGEWSRTDTPSQIKITNVLDNGKLEVEYFNPRSIYVSKAYWIENGTILTIYVELQDENYTGSNYKLNYNSERNVLIGEYFQAVEGVTYPVEFAKTK